MINSKLSKLKQIIKGYSSCLVAFSGGVDSSFLLAVAATVLPRNKLLAVTADSPTYPCEELLGAKRIAQSLGVRHKVIKTNEFRDKKFISNPIDRCYFCKRELFAALNKIAKDNKLNFVLDASTISDKVDFRPGSLAKKELKVRSPLQEAGLTKVDIRSLSKKLGLSTWDKPSLACLASRIPYGIKISREILERVHKGEAVLKKEGFAQVRLRHYNGLCRIEVTKKDVPRLLVVRNRIVDRLKKLGYNYVTVDLEGYRSGSMNEVIRK
jgi:uncharacterized protein